MEEKIIQTLKDLMSFKTIEPNKEEFIKLFNYIKDKTNKELIIKEYDIRDKKAMVISNTEDYNLDVIFATHIDVVPADNYDYLEDEENIYGRGTIDMKGSVAVLLELFNNNVFQNKVALFITSDEEIDGYSTEYLLKKYYAKLAIIPDGGSNFEFIYEEKGLLQLELSLQGKSAHSSQPFNGVNAITNLYDVYLKLIDKYPLPKSKDEYITSINLSKMEGGNANNTVADFAKMTLDIRHTSEILKEDILDYIKKINSEVKINILLKGNVFITDMNNKNIQKYLEVVKSELQRDVKIIGCESTSDAVYFSDKNIPAIIMNPDGYYPHSKKEYVNKNSLLKLYNIYKNFMKEGIYE